MLNLVQIWRDRGILLEWTKLVCTPAPGTLFVIHSLTHFGHVRRNYVPLVGVDTDLRYYVIRDCYLNIVVLL